jgi:protein kinase C substrate 80K-H
LNSKFDKFDGPENNIYKVHSHLHGTRCWNGPERSVKATIECGLNNEILEVSEPEKCEYHYRMISPAVCQSMNEPEQINTSNHHHHQDDSDNKSKKPVHEEL